MAGVFSLIVFAHINYPGPFRLGFVQPFQLSAPSFLSRGSSRAQTLLSYYYVFCHTYLFEWAIHPGMAICSNEPAS